MILIDDCRTLTERIPPYVEGALDPEERSAVRDHLSTCDKCRAAVARYQKVVAVAENSIGTGMEGRRFQVPADPRIESAEFARQTAHLREVLDEDDEVLGQPIPVSFLDSLSERFGSAPWWLISGAFHALLLLLVTLIGMAIMRTVDEDAVIVTDLEQKKEPEQIEEPKERTIIPQPVPIPQTEIETEQQPIVTHEEVELSDHVETADDSDAADTRGEDGISDVWLGGSGSVAALGLGGGGGGAFGRPGGAGGRLRRAIRGGGGKATESAVDKALAWLARNQKADGSWGVVLNEQAEWCEKGPMGITGLALLAFLGAGHTEKVGKYRENVQRAIGWIIGQQQADGALGKRPGGKDPWFKYGQAIAGMALAEASAMARVPATREAAQKAINCTVALQKGKGSDKLYWDYGKTPDISINGWFVMQLKSAKVAGLQVDPASFEGAIKFLDLRQSDPVPQNQRVDDGYDSGGHRYGYRSKTPGMNWTAIGNLCRLFTGTPAKEVRGAAAWMLQTNPPSWNANIGKGLMGTWPMYYMYYNTLTMFQVGGDLWNEWNTKMKKALVNNQRKDGEYDGSWDPLSKCEIKSGRVYSTALGAMCLEVYYRYLPMYRE